jgi:hypothetical protein
MFKDRVKLTGEALKAYADSVKNKSFDELVNSFDLSLYPLEQRILLSLLLVNGGSMAEDELSRRFEEEFERLSKIN